MYRFLHILSNLSLCLVAGFACVACSDADRADASLIDEPAFRVALRAEGTSRNARALGPSADDGTMLGNDNENRVHNATILFYQDKAGATADATGLNGAADTPILFGFYAPYFTEQKGSDGATYYVTGENILLKRFLSRGTYRVLALCNMGDLTTYVGQTLDKVRDHVVRSPYLAASSLANYDYFAMSSHRDEEFVLSDPKPHTPNSDPVFDVKLSVSRLAARIDFSPGDATGYGGTWGTDEITVSTTPETKISAYYCFPVTREITVSGSGTATPQIVENGDYFYLTSVTPFNVLQEREYAFKRVTKGTSTTQAPTYFGAETTSTTDGTGSNYVLTPWTLATGTDAATPPTYENPYATLTTDEKAFAAAEKAVTEIAVGGDLCYADEDNENLIYKVWCYAPENTILTSQRKQDRATGLLLRGYYAKRTNGTTEPAVYEYSPKTYEIFVRHTDPNNSNSDALPMKYGVVRNHVYRISIQRVSSVGLILLQTVDWDHIEAPEIQM